VPVFTESDFFNIYTGVLQRNKRVFKPYNNKAPGWPGSQKPKHVSPLSKRILDLLLQATEGERAFGKIISWIRLKVWVG